MTTSLTIIVSAGQSRSPEKRGLEEAIVSAVSSWDDVAVVAIPHLYDLVADGPSVQRMKQVHGPIVLFSWLYERAAHWVLDRLGVHGLLLPTEFTEVEDEEENDEDETAAALDKSEHDRPIHCIDLRVKDNAQDYLNELRRLAECYKQFESTATPSSSNHQSSPQLLTLANLFFDDTDAIASSAVPADNEVSAGWSSDGSKLERVVEHPTRRWYPVIDFSRCTNCMECIDFCLFGVYGVDHQERILVEQPDNCRKGCPACSRVCPANAIMFPQHKTPAIAGAPSGDASFKIDLSKLFGAPESDEDALAVAARERDEHLILAGRAAVGMPAKEDQVVGMRTTAVIKSQWKADNPDKDGLDKLIDQLDDLDL